MKLNKEECPFLPVVLVCSYLLKNNSIVRITISQEVRYRKNIFRYEFCRLLS